MSELIDYERYLPELKNTEFYVVKGNGGGGYSSYAHWRSNL